MVDKSESDESSTGLAIVLFVVVLVILISPHLGKINPNRHVYSSEQEQTYAKNQQISKIEPSVQPEEQVSPSRAPALVEATSEPPRVSSPEAEGQRLTEENYNFDSGKNFNLPIVESAFNLETMPQVEAALIPEDEFTIVRKPAFKGGAQVGWLSVRIDNSSRSFLVREELRALLEVAEVSTTGLGDNDGRALISFTAAKLAGVGIAYDPLNDRFEIQP